MVVVVGLMEIRRWWRRAMVVEVGLVAVKVVVGGGRLLWLSILFLTTPIEINRRQHLIGNS